MATVETSNLPPQLVRDAARDGGVRARPRARLLPHDLRVHRRRPAQRDRRQGRLPGPLSALAVRHGVRAAQQGLPPRAAEDLRDGDQQQPVLRLPDDEQRAGRPEAGDGPRLRPLRLLQEQLLVQQDQPQDDGRDGQPRQSRPPVHGRGRRRGGRGIHRRLPEHRGPDRHPLAVHPPPRRARAATTFIGDDKKDEEDGPPRFQAKDYMDSFINPPRQAGRGRQGAGGKAPRAEAVSRAAGTRRAAVPAGARAAQRLAGRRAVDHSRRGLLLRPAGADQDHERGLGQLLALDDHDPPGR